MKLFVDEAELIKGKIEVQVFDFGSVSELPTKDICIIQRNERGGAHQVFRLAVSKEEMFQLALKLLQSYETMK